jgi:DHA1 family multidrug resistance protein-like MFS transporter
MKHHKRNLVILSIAICLVSMSWTQVIPFLPKYLVQLGVKNNLTAWSALVLGLQSIAGIVFMPFWGKLGDKYGRKTMVMRAGFCLCAIYIGMAFCSRPWHLALFRFLNGMLTGFMPGAFALIATNTPTKKAGRYVAIAQSAAAIGSIMGPITGGILSDLVGIRGAMWMSGGFVFASTITVGLLVRESRKVHPQKPTSLLDDFVTCGREPTLRFIMVHNWINALIAGAVTSTLIIFLSQISPGLPSFAQGMFFAIPGILIALLALRWVKLGEQFSHRRVITIGLGGAGFFYMIMGLSLNVLIFLPAFIFCRMFATAINPLLSGLISGEVAPEFRGRAFGIQTSVATMGELSAQLLVASIGQVFGIHVLYFVIGAGVFSMGVFEYLSFAKKAAPACSPVEQYGN